LDRRTERPDGAGGGTPTVVTSRAADDDLAGDEQDTRPTGVMAPPRQSSRKPTAARSASAGAESPDGAVPEATANRGFPANGVSASGGKDFSANGAPVRDPAGPSDVDATIVDGVPALPADTIGAPRGARPEGPGSDQGTPENTGDSPGVSFGPRPSAGAPPSSAPTPGPLLPAADRAAPAKPHRSNSAPTAPPGPVSSRPGPSRSGPSGPASSGTLPLGRPASADPSVSPAAFAWETADPSANPPSSPARNFLRSGLAVRDVTAEDGSPGGSGPAAAGEAAPASGPAARDPKQKAPSGKAQSQKAQPKRSARQAHLTIARVEPWSVMKFSFVVSLVAFVILFVAVSVLYGILSGIGVFDSLQRVVSSVTSSQGSAGVNATTWFSASRVLGYTALLGSLNIVLITAMSTIGAVVYNLTSRLVGGVEVTLRETE